MSLIEILAGLLAAVGFVYLLLGPAAARGLLMSAADLLTLGLPGRSRSSSSRRCLGGYIHRVMEGERVCLSPLLSPVERAVYRVCRHR